MTTTIKPICACCREELHTVWRVTKPDGYVVCGSATCGGWVTSQGLSYYAQGLIMRQPKPKPAPTKRHQPRCAGCGGELPRRARDRFMRDEMPLCSLTCVQRWTT